MEGALSKRILQELESDVARAADPCIPLRVRFLVVLVEDDLKLALLDHSLDIEGIVPLLTVHRVLEAPHREAIARSHIVDDVVARQLGTNLSIEHADVEDFGVAIEALGYVVADWKFTVWDWQLRDHGLPSWWACLD